jgi:hypothetical protein
MELMILVRQWCVNLRSRWRQIRTLHILYVRLVRSVGQHVTLQQNIPLIIRHLRFASHM